MEDLDRERTTISSGMMSLRSQWWRRKLVRWLWTPWPWPLWSSLWPERIFAYMGILWGNLGLHRYCRAQRGWLRVCQSQLTRSIGCSWQLNVGLRLPDSRFPRTSRNFSSNHEGIGVLSYMNSSIGTYRLKPKSASSVGTYLRALWENLVIEMRTHKWERHPDQPNHEW